MFFEQRELGGQILRDERQLFRLGRLERGVQRAGRNVEQQDDHQHAAGQRDGKIVQEIFVQHRLPEYHAVFGRLHE